MLWVQELILGKSSAQLLPAGYVCSVPLLSPAFTCPFLLCLLLEGKDEAHLLLCCDLGLSTLLLCAGVFAVTAASESGNEIQVLLLKAVLLLVTLELKH